MWQSFKRVWPLFICQVLAFSAVTQAVFSASLIGQSMGGAKLATLPIALLPVGTALGILPVTKLMSIFGRRNILLVSILLLSLSNVLAGIGIDSSSFVLFCTASLCIGLCIAALAQLRFVAMEQVPIELQAGAASSVLLGGIAAAYIGPELGLYFRQLTSSDFAGSYYALAVVVLAASLFILGLPNKSISPQQKESGRSIKQLLKQHRFLTAVSGASVAYGIMSFIMTATPISMHEHFQHSLSDTKWVIQSHILAMFTPSLFSAWLIQKFGTQQMMYAGLASFSAAIAIAFSEQNLMGFWSSLVLLGIAWNFLFVAATVMLPSTHTDVERFTAQGFNDAIVFSIQAIVSLCSGIFLSWLGWQYLLLVCLPLIAWQLLLLSYKPSP